ncbi:MAG: DUF4349 domain-containing protein [Bulleidia sp.]|nr:DUF4349 domain-containing protein [Bulleidia sp.]
MKTMQKIIASAAAFIMLAGCGNTAGTTSMMTTEGIADTKNYDMAAAEAPSVNDAGTAETAITGDKLVYTGSISLETLDYDTTVSEVRSRIEEYKGIIENENESSSNYDWYQNDNDGNDRRYLYLTVRIPTESYEKFLDEMEGSGHVVSKSSNVENISRQYNDNSIEIEALEKQQTRLLEMLDQAQSVEDMVTIESRLSEVETQLNQKKSYQAQMDTDVEYSTVSIDISEVNQYTPSEDHPLGNFGKRFVDGVKSGWHDFLWFLQELVIFLVGHIPHIALLAGIVVLIKKLVSRRKQKKLEKKQAEPEKK